MFVAGLLVVALSFLLCFGNALAGEGAREETTRATFLGVVGGSGIAGGAIITSAVMSRRFVPLAVAIVEGLVGAVAGRSLYRLGVGESIMEWMLALCVAPIEMWLGWLGGASANRVVIGAALGGGIGATLAAVAFPILFNKERGHCNPCGLERCGSLVCFPCTHSIWTRNVRPLASGRNGDVRFGGFWHAVMFRL
jgi:hypothetical protein